MAASMGMGREMINWDKPIETIDGCKARLIETNAREPVIWHIVYVSSIADPYGFGDVFIVNNEGFRCDDRAIYSKRQEPFIRNARVKRKAWIRLPIYDYYKADTKEECEASITKSGYKAVYCEWEEEP